MKKLLEHNQHFTYLHTHVLTPKLLEKCIKNNIIVEADIAFDADKNEVFVGHPKKYYTDVIHKPLPSNISFEELSNTLVANPRMHIVFDCKDERVFPALKALVKKTGTDRVMFTALVKEWSQPYPQDATIEPHWEGENIKLDTIKQFQIATSTTWMGGIRAFDRKWLVSQKLTQRAVASAGKTFVAMGYLFSFKATRPPKSELLKLVDAGYVPAVPVDLYLRKPVFKYIGLTQFRFRATRLSA